MSEQDKFEAWWKEKGFNSVILRAAALTAWMARAEIDKEPQPAEDPDEWVVLDPVKYADHVPRVGVDQFQSAGKSGEWITQREDHSSETVGDFFEGAASLHRCRRRDLPKVEQVEQCAACDAPAEPGTVGCKDCNEYATAICSPEPQQWPKYYKPSQPSPVAMIRRDNDHYCTVFNNVGGQRRFIPWCYEGLPEITEAEAMALLKKPEPQPQKTRVRLWKNAYGSVMSNPDCEHLGGWQEIHHDSEGFYVENKQ